MYSSMGFHKCIELCNQHHDNQGIEKCITKVGWSTSMDLLSWQQQGEGGVMVLPTFVLYEHTSKKMTRQGTSLMWSEVKSLSCVWLFATPWIVAYQAPPSLGFSRQEYRSGLPFPSPGDLPNPGIERGSPILQADTLPSEPPGRSNSVLWGLKEGRDSWFWSYSLFCPCDYFWFPGHLVQVATQKAISGCCPVLVLMVNFASQNSQPSFNFAHPSCHVWMWELDYKESWVLKNWCFWTVVLEKTLESPLDYKETQPVHPKGDQSWVFIGRTDVEAETPILWPPDAKSWLIWKDPDAGKDWVQEEKGTTEDEMIGWHHRLNGHGFGWTPGVGDG